MSGASNRQKHREAEATRRAEELHAPRRLDALPPEKQELARQLMTQVLLGKIRDPDVAADEPEAA